MTKRINDGLTKAQRYYRRHRIEILERAKQKRREKEDFSIEGRDEKGRFIKGHKLRKSTCPHGFRYRRNCNEYQKASYRKNREHRLEYHKEWNKNNPHKIKAHNEARKIPLASECEFCGSTRNLQRHHFDYEFPQLFVTCCTRCHYYADRTTVEGI